MDSYLDSLTPRVLLKVVEEKSSSSFKFGDSKSTVLSTKTATIPATIGKDVSIKTDFIQNDLHLLLRKDSMKKSNVKMDFANDKVSYFDQNVDIILSSSGHYAVPISRTEQLLDNMEVLLTQKKYFWQ